jgi:signal transduction histidine kinase/ActR/RegA family two-component response regulator
VTSTPELYSLLGIAVFERLGLGSFSAVGDPPQWWRAVAGSAAVSLENIPFVEDFLLEAEKFWASGVEGLSQAGVWHPDVDGSALTLDVSAATTGKSQYLLIRNLDESGFGVTNVLQTARDGRLKLFQEIDQHLQLEKDLTRARDAAELLARAKTQFLANISHEIRTPLTAVLGMTDLLAVTNLDSEQRTFVESIRNSSDSLLRIVDDLLDFSRVESGIFEVESIPFKLASFAEQTWLRFQAKAEAKQLEFSIDVGDDLPDTIHGDPVRLAQISDNLISNAVKFTAQGHVRVNFRLNPRDPSQLLLTVADTGIGIPPEKQELIFQPFVQEDASTTRRYGGTGLGLAIVKKLTKFMRGDVWLESRLGRGTTFFVAIPVHLDISNSAPQPLDESAKRAAATEMAAVETRQIMEAETRLDKNARSTTGASTSSQPTLRKPNDVHNLQVLLAEDNAVIRMLITQMLNKAGHEVIIAENGQQAVDNMSENIDLVLMDCQMPVVDGFEATRLIRQHEQNCGKPRVPILALTAHAMAGFREKCIAQGMDDYLTKPLSQTDLLAIIAKTFSPQTQPSIGQ